MAKAGAMLLLTIAAALVLGGIYLMIREAYPPPPRLRHRRSHCPGLFRPWPDPDDAQEVRCDTCGARRPATPELLALAAADLVTAQRLRELERDGAELLRADRERAG